MTTPTLARVFYEAYCASSEWKNFRGEPCPQWDALPANIQKHWVAVADMAKQRRHERTIERRGFKPCLEGVAPEEIWTEVDLANLKKGDTFRMMESTGELVDGEASCVAEEDAHVSPTGWVSIKTQDNTPQRYAFELQEQINYLENQNRLAGWSVLDPAFKERATRKNRERIALLRLALQTMKLA